MKSKQQNEQSKILIETFEDKLIQLNKVGNSNFKLTQDMYENLTHWGLSVGEVRKKVRNQAENYLKKEKEKSNLELSNKTKVMKILLEKRNDLAYKIVKSSSIEENLYFEKELDILCVYSDYIDNGLIYYESDSNKIGYKEHIDIVATQLKNLDLNLSKEVIKEYIFMQDDEKEDFIKELQQEIKHKDFTTLKLYLDRYYHQFEKKLIIESFNLSGKELFEYYKINLKDYIDYLNKKNLIELNNEVQVYSAIYKFFRSRNIKGKLKKYITESKGTEFVNQMMKTKKAVKYKSNYIKKDKHKERNRIIETEYKDKILEMFKDKISRRKIAKYLAKELKEDKIPDRLIKKIIEQN